jgi:hypothetical protein
MRNLHKTLLATAFTGLLGAAAPGVAQPVPPPPPGLPAPPDLHVRIAPVAPPAPRHEVVVVRPSPQHVYVKGYWHYGGNEWAWTPGAWVAPPRHNTHWVVAHYKKVHGGWQYVPGHWSHEHVIS